MKENSVLLLIQNALYIDGKTKCKGVLKIYNDGFIFSGKNSLSADYDICELTAVSTVAEVHGLFGTKRKAALRLSVPGMKDAFFVLTEGEISSVIGKIKETAEKEKFRRLEKNTHLPVA